MTRRYRSWVIGAGLLLAITALGVPTCVEAHGDGHGYDRGHHHRHHHHRHYYRGDGPRGYYRWYRPRRHYYYDDYYDRDYYRGGFFPYIEFGLGGRYILD